MTGIEARSGKTEDEDQEDMDDSLTEALELDFASLEEVKEAFRS